VDWIDPELHMWIMLDMAAHMPVMAGKTERPTPPELPISLPIEAKSSDEAVYVPRGLWSRLPDGTYKRFETEAEREAFDGLRPRRAGMDRCPDLAGEPGGEAR
jgi:hypothetical protein